IDGAKTEGVSRAEYQEKALDLVKAAAPFYHYWAQNNPNKGAPNEISFMKSRPGGWGIISGGNFNLEDNEALVISVESLDADYMSLHCGDPWGMLSCPYIEDSGSLNIAQSVPDADGSYTFV